MSGKPVKARWDALEREDVRPGVRRSGFAGTEAMTVLNELEPGMQPAPHRHDMEQISLVLEGAVRFDVDGETFVVEAGEVLLIPGGAEHHGVALGDVRAVNLDVFAPPRPDYAHLTAWMDERVG